MTTSSKSSDRTWRKAGRPGAWSLFRGLQALLRTLAQTMTKTSPAAFGPGNSADSAILHLTIDPETVRLETPCGESATLLGQASCPECGQSGETPTNDASRGRFSLVFPQGFQQIVCEGSRPGRSRDLNIDSSYVLGLSVATVPPTAFSTGHSLGRAADQKGPAQR